MYNSLVLYNLRLKERYYLEGRTEADCRREDQSQNLILKVVSILISIIDVSVSIMVVINELSPRRVTTDNHQIGRFTDYDADTL